MKTLIIEMPDDWKPEMCPDCHIDYSGCVGICGEKPCPLARAKEAGEVRLGVPLTRTFEGKEINRYGGEVVKLYAVKGENDPRKGARKMALYHVKRHNGHGGCDIYPIQGPRYPGWLRVVPAKVWLRRLKNTLLRKQEG